MGLCLLAGVECLLRLFNLGQPTEHVDPLVGFSRVYPLFDLDETTNEYKTARSRLHFFGPEHFSAEKPLNGFRAFCLGGSTVLGHPYRPDTAFPRWLQLELTGTDPSRQWEIVNCGGISYASYRLIPILQEVLKYEPDVIIVMTGHNEFLEDRTYQAIKERSPVRVWMEDQLNSLHIATVMRHGLDALAGGDRRQRGRTVLKEEVDARLDHKSGYASYHRDPVWRDQVIRHFRQNLTVLVTLCQQAGVPIILVNPGSNVSDCPPFKSEHRQGLTRHELAKWTEIFQSGEAREPEDPAGALVLYREAEVLDSEYAQLVYSIARCLHRLGRHDEARKTYVEAKDLDICPLRAPEAINRAVFEVGKETGIPVVDARFLLEATSPDQLAGYNWYVDHLHPSIRGHQLIAESLAARMEEADLVTATRELSRRERREIYRRHLGRLGVRYLTEGRLRVTWLENWAGRQGRDGEGFQDPRRHLDLGHVYLDLGEEPNALASYRQSLKEAPSLARPLLEHALELFRAGRPLAARSAIQMVQEDLIRRDLPDTSLGREAALATLILELENGNEGFEPDQFSKLQMDDQERSLESSPWMTEIRDMLGQLEK